MDPRLLILMGIKHCGKTTIGTRLAAAWDIPFYDLDDVILELYPGISVRDVYKQAGKREFQRLEAAGAALILSRASRRREETGAYSGICALGGGTIENREAMDRLTGAGTFCYIRENEEVLYKRIISRGLPAFLSADDPEGDFTRLYLRRTRLYEQQADITIDAMGKGAEELYAILKKQL
jgi:shikimate kinase